MAKTKISEFDTNPDLNTDINSINIAEGCSPANINNAIRQLMADLKEWQNGSQDKYIAPAGTAAAPSWTFNGDTDTGFYSAAGNQIGVAANGSSVGTFTSAGFVGNVTGNVTGNASTVTNGVYTTGAQTIAGVKTFSDSPVVPTASLNDNTTKAASTAFVVAQVTDYAPSKSGTNATGTWGISISGNAATATNGITTSNISTYAPSPTGTGASGTWAISITGNAATATSATTATTASNGGVTSVNGQTGAVTQTSVDSIGSYTVCLYVPGTHPGTNTRPLAIGDTVAGSTLRYGFTTTLDNASPSNLFNDFDGQYFRYNNTTYDGGGSSLSGTWRCMGRPIYLMAYDDLTPIYGWKSGLFVRVS
jgi:hypothetical protein